MFAIANIEAEFEAAAMWKCESLIRRFLAFHLYRLFVRSRLNCPDAFHRIASANLETVRLAPQKLGRADDLGFVGRYKQGGDQATDRRNCKPMPFDINSLSELSQGKTPHQS